MYFDEDGELAHEFYEEVLPKKKGGKRKMRRVDSKSLTPQVNHVKWSIRIKRKMISVRKLSSCRYATYQNTLCF